ncbi:MAG: TonB-dependent receptor, partial [Burkholderiaceae bacterium]
RTGLRLNAAKRDGSTGIDREKRELDVISLGADYRGNDFRLSADIGYQNHHIDAPRPSVTPNGGIPTAPDARRNFAQPWTYSSERQTFGTVRGEFDLNANMTAWVAAGMREGTESNVLANPSATSSGVTSAFRFDNAREDSVKTAEAGLRGKLRTGSVSHTWAATASNFQSSSRNAYAFSNFAGFAGSLTAPFDVAIPAANFFTGGSLNAPLVTERIDMRSIALADTLSFAQDRVLLTVGARHQNIQQNAYNYDTGVLESAYDKSRLTPMTGIVFKANPHLSLYANYIEGLAKGDVAPATSGGQPVTNAGSALSPYQSKQKEIGVKYDEGNVGASLALFSTEKPFGIVQDAVFQAAGEQRNQGAEVSVFGEAARGLRLLGGVTLLDAKQTRTSDGTTDGKTAIGVPKTQINLGTEWDVPNATGLTLTARALYTSSQYADAANTLSVPAWTRLDLGARYATKINNQKVTFRARLDNATSSNYWASVGGYPGANYMVLGTPRIFSINASIDF